MVSEELSQKLRIITLIGTLMVLLRHSLNMVAFYKDQEVPFPVLFVETGFSVMTEIAIPLFFLISGFFFFRYNYYDISVYKNAVKKKFRSLIVPFIVWNLVGLVTMWLTGLLHTPTSFGNFLGGLILSVYYGPLWYVRNILLMMFCAPLYYWIYRVDKGWLYAIIVLLIYHIWYPVDCSWYSIEGVLFFFLGGVLQQHKEWLEKKITPLLSISLVLVWIFVAFFRPFWDVELNKLTTILGIISFWYVCDYISDRFKSLCLRLSSFSFLVYVLHFFFVKGMKVLIAGYYPQNQYVALCCYFLLPIIVSAILMYVAYVWKNKMPQSYSICVGGR